MKEFNDCTKILSAARILIANGYCKHSYAKNEKGSVTAPISNDAVEWCPIGAISASFKELCDSNPNKYFDSDKAFDYFRQAIIKTYPLEVDSDSHGLISGWSDDPERIKEDVISMFDKAIEFSEASS